MRLVVEGKVDLDALVRRYVPELELADEQTAAEITVLNLLNHTAGLDWRIITDTGDGDDALAGQVAKMAELKLIASPGHPGLLQPGGVQPGRPDRGEGHRTDVRAGRRLTPVRAAGAVEHDWEPRTHLWSPSLSGSS